MVDLDGYFARWVSLTRGPGAFHGGCGMAELPQIGTFLQRFARLEPRQRWSGPGVGMVD